MDFSFETNNYEQEEDKRKSLVISVFIHLLILLLFLFPFFKELQKTEELNGVLVVFGNPQQNNEEASQAIVSNEENKELSKQAEEPVIEAKVATQKPETKENVKQKVELVVNETRVDEDEVKASKSKAKKAQEEREKKEAEEEAKRVELEAQEAERRKEEQRKAQEDQYEKQKSEFGSLFKGERQNKGSGQTGDPFGNSDEGALDAISKGKGAVGEGLGGRSVLYEPEIRDSSQKEGRVVVKICVNQSGKVISAKYTQKGSSTTDLQLIKKAEKAALEYVFSESKSEKQCGELAVEFKLK